MNILVINDVDPAEDSLLQQLRRFSGIREIRYVGSYLESTPSLLKNDIQLVFLDSNSASKNWIEASTYIQTFCPQLPIVLVSPDDHFAEVALQSGISDYLITPISSNTLARVMHKLIDN